MLTPIQGVPNYAKMASHLAVAKAVDNSGDTPVYAPNSLARLRQHANLSQPKLAALTGGRVSQQQISKLEQRKIELKGYQIRALALALNCTADEIMRDPQADGAAPLEPDATLERTSHDFRLEVSELMRERQLSERDDRFGFLEAVRQLFVDYQRGRRIGNQKK